MGSKMELPIRSDLQQAVKECKATFWKNFSLSILSSFEKLAEVFKYVPEKVCYKAVQDAFDGIGFVFTNVAMGKEPITI